MRKTITLFIASLAFLSGSNIVWGQQSLKFPGYNNQVELRNHPAMNDVGNLNLTEFGAGESVTINNNSLQSVPYTGGGLLPTISPNTINIGSVQDTNLVIRTYSGNGYGIGWISLLRTPMNGNPNHSCGPNWPVPTRYPDGKTYNGKTMYFALTPQPNTQVVNGKDVSDVMINGEYIVGTPADYVRRNTSTPSSPYYTTTGDQYSDCTEQKSAKFQHAILYSFNSFNFDDFFSHPNPLLPSMINNPNVWNVGKTSAGWLVPPCGVATLFEAMPLSTPSIDGSMSIQVGHHQMPNMIQTTANAISAPSRMYTTTVNNIFIHNRVPTSKYTPQSALNNATYLIDEVPLIQFNGAAMTNGEALADQDPIISDADKSSANNIPPTPTAPGIYYMDNYQRPTNVAVQGINTFNDITLRDLRWKFQSNLVDTLNGRMGSSTNCNSGMFYTFAKDVQWVSKVEEGATFLDAAVQLINGAMVCVSNNVQDNTSSIASMASTDSTASPRHQETNALLVLPIADRVTLRTKGNFQANMANERDSVTTRQVLYRAGDFPDPEADIYLYQNTISPAHAFNSPTNLSGFSNPSITQHAALAPTQAATATIFGVYGNYLHTGNMARIHTDTATTTGFNGKIPGAIEVGPATLGKEHYNVYTSGILKNFEGCSAPNNFTMNFGNPYGKMPNFAFTEKEPMYILNYGNNGDNAGCVADIHFYDGAPDPLTNAFANATDEGALQIQALSDVEFRSNTTIEATIKGNNLYLLSDGGNVVTQKFNIVSDWYSNVGQGLVTFWAEDRTPGAVNFSTCANTDANRNAQRGNIYLNDSARVTRTSASTNGTASNLIAANNIRTAMFDYNSANTNNDTTNVISRKGDIYLGYSVNAPVYSGTTPNANGYNFNDNVFTYTIADVNNEGVLNIKAGYDDQNNNTQFGGGNIYFTHINANMVATGNYPTNIIIPFSNEYTCSSTWSGGMLHERLSSSYPNAMMHYEHAGIIGGVGRCGTDVSWGTYGGQLLGATGPGTGATDTSLIYRANNGQLLVDAGTRGNIIMNQGSYMDFQNDQANAFFLTRYGDIDMRNQTNVANLMGSVLFLANSELPNKLDVTPCGCDEQRNNVYLQDFQFRIDNGEGSIFMGADNNIKLQYGGLRNIGTQRDPFLSEDAQYPCGSGKYHCDSDTSANKARELILDFNKASTSGNGGFAAVSSDLIDVYKNLVYNGGSSGKGMSTVPSYGSLHGEAVAGYGLYIKTQANKKNWNKTDHDVNSTPSPLVGAACETDFCTVSYLHQTARVTFHADARLYAENQKVLIASPVLETFGNADYNTHLNKGSKTSILIQADSLIYHDSLIIDGPKTQFATWSKLERDMPIIRLGHQRFTPPTAETGCQPCYVHTKGANGLDSVFVTFRNDASVKRLHTLVAEHAVISFLTDSFDHRKGNPTLNAKFYTDIFKIRNHVELFKTPDHTHDGHFELISEEQMESKDYAGIYSRQLHMEPIAPTCSNFGYSQLWLQDPALDVITSSTLGGFGWLHADVHVENQANLFPGYASLQHNGNCYEQKAGILKTQDLRLDKGANLKFSIGDKASPFVETYDCQKTSESFSIGQYADCLDVDSLTIYGSVNLDLVIRPEGLVLNPGESRCFPVIRYKSVQDEVLNHLHMKKLQLTSDDHSSINGTYYLTLDMDTTCNIVYICIATIPDPVILRPINIPTVPGVTVVSPTTGTHYIKSSSSFRFTLKFDTERPLKVLTGRIINGKPEELFGTKNANGEYVYMLNYVTEPIRLAIGPDFASEDPNSNEDIVGALVWSHNSTLYIKVDRADMVSIYSVTGQLIKQIELTEGDTSVPMARGVYIVTLKDGSVHKVIVR